MLAGEQEADQHARDLVIVQGSPVSARRAREVLALTFLTTLVHTSDELF